MTRPVPGTHDPSGVPAPGMYSGELPEADRSPAAPSGQPPWEELPQSQGVLPPQEVPQLRPFPQPPQHPPGQAVPRGRGALRRQRALRGQGGPRGQEARLHAATPLGRPPAHAATHARFLVTAGLAVLGALAALTGLYLPENGTMLLDEAQYWSVFAALCALVQLAPLARPVFGWTARRAWTIGAAGVAGLLLFWVLIVLPVISTNAAFVVTAGVAAMAGGSWAAPGRRI